MVIANPRIHVICGVCGSKDHFDFSIEQKWICDKDGNETPGVVIYCDNCSTITSLNDLMPEKTKKDTSDGETE